MLDGETNFGCAETFASILQGVHAKLDRLTVGQQQIANSLGVSLKPGCTLGNERCASTCEVSKHCTPKVTGSVAEVRVHGDSKVSDTHSEESIDCDTGNAETLEVCENKSSATSANLPKISYLQNENAEALRLCSRMSSGMAVGNLQLRAFMQEERQRSSQQFRSGSRWSDSTRRPRLHFASFSKDDSGLLARIKRSLPLQRYSMGVFLFDFLGVLLLFKDSVQVPYTVVYKFAWHINGSKMHLVALDTMATAFWTFDLMLRFVISEESEKDDVLNDVAETPTVRIAAMRYLKGRFIVDLVLLVLDWYSCLMEASQGAAPAFWKFARFIKFSRIVRIFTVIRSNKFAHIKDILIQKFEGHEMVLVIIDFIWSTLRLLLLAVWLSHFGACVWIFLQMECSRGNKNWEVAIAQMHDKDAESFVDADLSHTYRYSMAYYWALTTMFSSASFLPPMTTAECWFSSGCVIVGVLSVTTVIASTSAHLVRIMEKKRERMVEREHLRNFLKQHKIRPLLSLQIQRQARERSLEQARVAEEQVQMISCLSSELRNQLRFNVYGPVLHGRPLWRAFEFIDGDVMWSMCVRAVSFKRYTPGEIVFAEHSIVEGSFTLVWGSMKYSCLSQKATARTTIYDHELDEHDGLTLLPGHTACENSPWIEWETVGQLEALGPCEMLVCSSKGLAIVMTEVNSTARGIIRGYAKAVIDFIVFEQETHTLSDISIETDHDSIVSWMPTDLRVSMSTPALIELRKKISLSWAMSSGSSADSRTSPRSSRRRSSLMEVEVDAIQQEVADGRCNLGQDESDKILRVVRIAVISFWRADGLICVEVGHVPDSMNKPIPRIRLPGRKLQMQETLKDCVQKVIRKRFAVLESNITLSYGSVDVEVGPSKSYSIATKYIRFGVDAVILNTGVLTSTPGHQCAWGGEALECFAWRDADDLSVLIYAWMTPGQYYSLKDLDRNGETLVASWIDAFTSTELEDARRGSLLMTL